MDFVVFISYSSDDISIAHTVCNAIEKVKIGCWIASRDIIAGQNYPESIVNAISNCELMVLVFSKKANDSEHVCREVEIAFNKKKIIIPFRIEDFSPSKSLAYSLSITHYLDAFNPPIEDHISKLVTTIKKILNYENNNDSHTNEFQLNLQNTSNQTVKFKVERKAHISDIGRLFYINDSNILISLDYSGNLKRWDIKDGKLLEVYKDIYLKSQITENGKFLISNSDIEYNRGHSYYKTIVYDLTTMNELFHILRNETGVLGHPTTIVTPDSKYLILNSGDEIHSANKLILKPKIEIWSLEDFKLLHSLQRPAGIISANNQHFLSATIGFVCYDSDIQIEGPNDPTKLCLWSIRGGALLKILDVEVGSSSKEIFISNDGEIIAVSDAYVHSMYSTKKGNLLNEYHSKYNYGIIRGILYSAIPNRNYLLARMINCCYTIWDLTDCNHIATIEFIDCWLDAISPDGTLLAVAHRKKLNSNDYIISIWNLDLMTKTIELDCHSDVISSMTFINNNKLVTGNKAGNIRIWDLERAVIYMTLFDSNI